MIGEIQVEKDRLMYKKMRKKDKYKNETPKKERNG